MITLKNVLQKMAQKIDAEPGNRILRDDYLTLKVESTQKNADYFYKKHFSVVGFENLQELKKTFQSIKKN